MAGRPSTFLLLAALCGTAQPVPSQGEPQRERALGLATRADGSPWGGARVQLVHRPRADMAFTGVPDVIETRTDEEGRWRADVLPGKQYAVWARSPVVDGSYTSSGLASGVMAGNPTVIAAEDALRFTRRMQLVGLDAWAHLSPLRVFVTNRVARPVLCVEVPLNDDGWFELPQLAGTRMTVEVFGRGPRLVWSRNIRPIGPTREGDERLEVPPPYPLSVAVTDTATDRRVPGVEIRSRYYAEADFGTFGTTDAKGHALVELALHRGGRWPDQASWLGGLLFLAPGYAAGYQETSKLYVFDESVHRARIERGQTDLSYPLLPGGTLKGRVIWSEERPAAGLTLLLYSRIWLGGGRSRFGIPPRVFTTDEAGCFALPGCSDAVDYRITALLDAKARAALGEDAQHPLGAEALLAAGKGGADLGELRLDRRAVRRLELHEADGSPAAYAEVLWTELAGDIPRPLTQRADRRGRAAILSLVDQPLALFCGTSRGYVARTVDGPAAPLRLVLDPALVCRGTVRELAGKPLPGAELSLVGVRALPGHPEPALVSCASRLRSVYALEYAKTKTDDSGGFELVLPCRGVTLDLSVWDGPGRSARVEVPFDGEVDGDPVTVAVDLPTKDGR